MGRANSCAEAVVRPCLARLQLQHSSLMAKAKTKNPNDNMTEDTPCKKRGQPSDFMGAQLEFLTDHVADYLAASRIKGKDAKTDGLVAFWPRLFAKYWRCFPWNLPFDQDPDPDTLADTLDADDTEDAFEPLEENLTPEERE